MRLAAVGSNCIDYYNNIDGGKAFPGSLFKRWIPGCMKTTNL